MTIPTRTPFGRILAAIALASLAAFPGVAANAAVAAIEAAELKRVPFQRSNYNICTGNYCQRQLYKVPAKKRLDVLNVSCEINVAAPGAPFRVGILRKLSGGGQSIAYFPATYMATEGATAYYALHTETLLYANAGERLVVFANSTDTTSQIHCYMSGELVTLK